MRKDFSVLQAALVKAAENYFTIADFSVEAPFGNFFPVKQLDAPATKISQIAINFLDPNGELIKAFEAGTIEAGAYAKHFAYSHIFENCVATLAEIDAEVTALTATEADDFRALKQLKQFFTNLKPALERWSAHAEKDFESVFYRDLGQRIRQVRTARGLTVEKFARQILTSQVNVTRYEWGTRTPSPATIYRISKVFDISLDWLLGGDAK